MSLSWGKCSDQPVTLSEPSGWPRLDCFAAQVAARTSAAERVGCDELRAELFEWLDAVEGISTLDRGACC